MTGREAVRRRLERQLAVVQGERIHTATLDGLLRERTRRRPEAARPQLELALLDLDDAIDTVSSPPQPAAIGEDGRPITDD